MVEFKSVRYRKTSHGQMWSVTVHQHLLYYCCHLRFSVLQSEQSAIL